MKKKSAAKQKKRSPRKKDKAALLSPDELLEREQLLAELETLRAAQVDIEHSQQLYADLFEHAPIGYVNLTASGRIENANNAAIELLSSKNPIQAGMPFQTYIIPADRELFAEHLRRCKSGRDREIVTELRVHLAKGIARHVELLSRRASVFGTPRSVFRTVIRDVTAAKAAEAKLRASELQLRAIVEQTNAGVARIDRDYRIVFCNRQFCKMLGYECDALAGAQYRDLTHPDDRQAESRGLLNLFRRGQPFHLEKRVLPKKGAPLWVGAHLSPQRDGEGPVTSAVVVTIDISERREREAALRRSEEQFRRAIEEAPIPVIMHAEDGQVLEISRTWTELTGYGREDMTSFDAWLNCAYGYGAEVVRERMRKIFRGKAVAKAMEFEIHTRSGDIRSWLFHASPVGRLSDGRRFIIGMALDITDRKAAEAALAAGREQVRLIVENAREYAIFSMDIERRITSWNVGAQRLLGYTEPEVLGRPGDLIFTQEDREAGEPEKEARIAARDGKALDERWHVRKDGSRFWASGVMMPIHNAQENTIGLVKIFRDETDARQARQALEQSREDLRKALAETEQARAAAEAAGQAKDHFLAILSHELRTPLTPINMTAHALLRRPDLPADLREKIQLIRRNVQLEARLVDDLLDVTRISRGKMEIIREPMALHEAVQRAIEVCEPDIEAKRQRLTLSLRASSDRIEGDSARLQQVVWNLLKNASKFTPEGGEIHLSTRNRKGAWVLEIRDTGIGMEPEDIDRVFDPFVQANIDITRKFGGLGLGLAIAKATTETHGGKLTAASEGRDKGAVFTVTLPVP